MNTLLQLMSLSAASSATFDLVQRWPSLLGVLKFAHWHLLMGVLGGLALWWGLPDLPAPLLHRLAFLMPVTFLGMAVSLRLSGR
ncbi:hypothetical protein [Kitasatospora cineracea]|uniref:hypothetical protein n=1 Tax=Kitasatospora cineracea TaxID=88074 RepID=UPI00367DF507